jgi:3'(2'), 5'-bisphosphate nucleotidase
MSPLEKELEIAKALALEAGNLLMDYYRGETAVQWKGVDDPVTAADHAASELLVSRLAAAFPGDGILSEELPDDGSRLRQERVWMIDPMDGTRQFVDRIDEFAVQIGLTIAGEPQLGIVYHPARERMFYAATGLGAYVEEKWSTKRLQVPPEAQPEQMAAAMSRSHSLPVVKTILASLGVNREIASGSVGLKMGMLAEGLAHIYLHPAQRTSIWDTCGPEAILRTAGGVVTDIYGDPLRYVDPTVRNLRGIVASNGPLHARIIRTIEATLKEAETRS